MFAIQLAVSPSSMELPPSSFNQVSTVISSTLTVATGIIVSPSSRETVVPVMETVPMGIPNWSTPRL